MRLLLDTHLLLSAAQGPPERLPGNAASLIADPANELRFSPASIWEVAIKSGLGREDFEAEPHVLRRGLLDNGYLETPITSEHAAAVRLLPPIHKDPFDRLLVAQATIEGLILLTTDAMVARYGGAARRV